MRCLRNAAVVSEYKGKKKKQNLSAEKNERVWDPSALSDGSTSFW